MEDADLATRPRSALALLFCAISSTLLIAACGDTDDSARDPSGRARDERPVVIRQADGLCRKAEARFQRLPNVVITTYDVVVPRIVRNERRLAADLRALKAPQGDRRLLARLADALERQSRQVDHANRIYSALEEEGTYEEYKQHVKRASELNREIREAALDLGARSCARPPLRTKYL